MKLPDYFRFPHTSLELITDDDIDETVEMINKAYAYQDAVKGAPRTNPGHLRERVATSQLYVVKEQGKIIGCLYLEPNGNSLHFGLLTVDEVHRRTGLGPALLAAVEKYGRAKGFDTIGLAYMSLAPWLKKYYKSHGFRETGQVDAWGSIDLVWMDKQLKKA